VAKVDVGDAAPEFELPGTGGRTYRLSDYRGKKLVIAFYPGDFTAVCTKQFCSYRDEGERLDQLGADVLGISPQGVDSHERFAEEKKLNVPLLADEDKAVAKAYGIVAGPLVRRAIFVIDEEGKIGFRKVTLAGLTYESVADLERALGFYCGVLGFELMQRYGTDAAFISAGGYHHHIGLNTWESKGGHPPPSGTTGPPRLLVPDRPNVRLVPVVAHPARWRARDQHGLQRQE